MGVWSNFITRSGGITMSKKERKKDKTMSKKEPVCRESEGEVRQMER
jgi:hypothetical protein